MLKISLTVSLAGSTPVADDRLHGLACDLCCNDCESGADVARLEAASELDGIEEP
jgi:hypothetical protein